MSDLITISYLNAPHSLRKEFKAMYKESFIRTERMSVVLMKTLSLKIEILFDLVLDEKEKIVGFYYAYKKDDFLFLYYLAVKSEYRGIGLGKKILSHLENKISCSTESALFVIAESVRKCEYSNEIKKRRSRFYLSFGFEMSDYIVKDFSGYYDLYTKPQCKISDIKDVKTIIKTLNPFEQCKIIKLE